MPSEHAADYPLRGICRLYGVDEASGLWLPELLAEQENAWMYTWGYLACKAIGQRDASYGINCMYIEYANVASPGDPVSIPSFNRQDSRSYYEGLGAGRDYLRIPLRSTPFIDAAPGYESYFPDPGTGNRLTVSAQSSGTQGTLGRPFSDTVNSKVAGVALVAAPSLSDRTKDVLFSRFYYSTDKQKVKSAGQQFGIQYGLTFG